mmetsp:Transcript_39157/g.59723  ORF Transcript_39157/g.59723 Transcript_39157/m.59723 type:complete len:161 (+) Transcript_39157:325-807(+)
MFILVLTCLLNKKLITCCADPKNTTDPLVRWYRFAECSVFNGCATFSHFWQYVATVALLQGVAYAGLNYSKYGFLFLHLSHLIFIVFNTVNLAFVRLASEGSSIASWLFLIFTAANFHWNTFGEVVSSPQILLGVSFLIFSLSWMLMAILKYNDLNNKLG